MDGWVRIPSVSDTPGKQYQSARITMLNHIVITLFQDKDETFIEFPWTISLFQGVSLIFGNVSLEIG